MDLPVFRKGLELVSAQLNKLSQGIRAAQVTSVIGGTFTRTPGGTTIIIDRQPITTGGGGGGGGTFCWYESTNASTPEQLRIMVSQAALPTNNPNAPYIWPDGMGIGFPPYYLVVTETCYVYLTVLYDTTTYFVSTEAGSVSLEVSPTIMANTDTIQYILLGTVLVEDNAITSIENVCSQPVVNPCLLQLETPPPPPPE
jgi:hypothetical protein